MDDWESVDWQPIMEKIDKGDADVGLSAEEFLGFLQWLRKNNEELFDQFILCLSLTERGFSRGDALFWSARPKALRKAISYVKKWMPLP